MIRRLLSLLFLSLVSLRAHLYSKNMFKSHRSGIKIISIGNVSLGGAGKTPFTLWLARRLMDKGLRRLYWNVATKVGFLKK
jgi:tetraacyldisaccharide 4'-kinase